MNKHILKKALAVLGAAVLALSALAGCGDKSTSAGTGSSADAGAEIAVISREDGSGTRGAFIELLGIEAKNAEGKKVDRTIDTADITNSTQVMLTSVAGNPDAIGYVSMGALNDTVKALAIDGATPTVANVKNGSYKVSRPFNIATKGDLSPLATDFIAYILSAEGQAVVEKNGYIAAVENAPAFAGTKPAGTLTIAGSSSVTPVMEKLKEAYAVLNPDAVIEIQQSDSTTGMTSAAQGVCEIGMASRELKDSEKEQGLKATVIAMDGIAVIVNKANAVNGLTSEQVCAIYTGEAADWGTL